MLCFYLRCLGGLTLINHTEAAHHLRRCPALGQSVVVLKGKPTISLSAWRPPLEAEFDCLINNGNNKKLILAVDP